MLLAYFILHTTSAQSFDPFNGQAKDFHVKLDRYFSSASNEIASRKILLTDIRRFIENKDWKLRGLKIRLDEYEKFTVLIERHKLYNEIRELCNTRDTAAINAENALGNISELVASTVDKALEAPEVIRMNPVQINELGLSDYRYMIHKAMQNTEHTRSAKELEFISKLSDPMLNGLISRYNDFMDGIHADSIPILNGKKLDPIHDRSQLYLVKDQNIRAKLSIAYYQAYGSHKELAAATLIDITRAETALAQVNGFKDAPTSKYNYKLELGDDSVRAVLTEMFNYTDVLRQYQQIESAETKKITGQQTINSWDLSMASGFRPENKTFEQARIIILNALKPLGMDYVQHFSWLMDPKNGALEIAGGPNRAPGGTSISYPGVPTSFYMAHFGGDLQSMLTMIHEGGHAIHRKLMDESLKVPTYASGPNFLFEAVAVFNELLLLDGLADSSKSLVEKAFYTKSFGDFLAHEIFTSAQEGSFEQGLYDKVSVGSIIDAKGIDSLYAGIMNRYDIFFKNEPDRKSEWVQRRLFFEDPLYNINYLYAILVACKFYNLSKKDPQYFVANYNRLLRNGFDDDAEKLIKKFMGFDFGHGSLLSGSIELMKAKSTQLRGFYGNNLVK